MAGVAFVATRDSAPTERRVTPTSAQQSPERDHSTYHRAEAATTTEAGEARDRPGEGRTSRSSTTPASPAWPAGSPRRPPRRAGRSSAPTTGTAPSRPRRSTTRRGSRRAGQLLALDLGIRRTMPAVDPMRLDRLTVILTAAPRAESRPPPRPAATSRGSRRPTEWWVDPWGSRPPKAEQRYAALVAARADVVVGLDFDGTLAPIVDDPESPTSTPTRPRVLIGPGRASCAPSR